MADLTLEAKPGTCRWAKRVFLALFVFPLLILLARAQAQIGNAHLSQVEKSDFPVIKLYLDVVDTANRPVEGLRRSDFQVFEEGKPVNVSSFADPGTPRSLTTFLVVDRSGSMEKAGKLDGLKAAASSYIRAMREIDQIGILAFNNNVEEVQPITPRKELLLGALNVLRPGGGTAFYDAIAKAIKAVGKRHGRRLILAITDGMDNKSWNSLDGVINLATKYGVPVYTIGLGARSTRTTGEEGVDEGGLRQLAEQTGGLYFYAPSAGELVRIYELLSRRFQASYELTYTSPRQIKDGTTRNVMVIVRVNGASLETAHSYYVPGVIVPAASASLFVGLLLPLLLLACAPPVLRRWGPMLPPTLKGWGTGLRQKGKALLRYVKGMRSAKDILYLVPLGNAPSFKTFPVKKGGIYHIGSDQRNDLVISHPSVAPKHARLEWTESYIVVSDLGSHTGTFVNYLGQPGKERRVVKNAVQVGSLVRFGNVSFIVAADTNADSQRSGKIRGGNRPQEDNQRGSTINE